MSLPVTVFSSDDAGAPQIVSRKPSEFIDILKKCLVYGYGTKNSLGWSIVDEDAVNYKVAFSNDYSNGGSAGVSVFYSNDGLDNTGGYIRFTSASAFTDFNTMLRQGYIGSFILTHTKWILIGTAKAFYFFCYSASSFVSSGSLHTAFFIGDYESFFNNDAHTFIHVGSSLYYDTTSQDSKNTLNYTMAVQRKSQNVAKIWDTDGGGSGLYYSLVSGFGDNSGYSSITEEPSEISLISQMHLVLNISNTSVAADRTGIVYQNSALSPARRGFLPGLITSSQGGFKGALWPLYRSINGQQHMIIQNDANNGSMCWLNTEEW